MSEYRDYLKRKGIIKSQVGGRILTKMGPGDLTCEEILDRLKGMKPGFDNCLNRALEALRMVEDSERFEDEAPGGQHKAPFPTEDGTEQSKSQPEEIDKLVRQIRKKASPKPATVKGDLEKMGEDAVRAVAEARTPPKRAYRPPVAGHIALDKLLISKGYEARGGRSTVADVVELAAAGKLEGGEILECLGLGKRAKIPDSDAVGKGNLGIGAGVPFRWLSTGNPVVHHKPDTKPKPKEAD